MDDITVIIPVSPIPSHPDTGVIEQTLEEVRKRLPTSEIIIMFDSPAPTLMHLQGRYETYKQTMLWKIEHEYENIVPLVFDVHSHQSLMTKEALKLVRTPLLLWSEQDTPLHGEIPLEDIAQVVQTGYANLVRFHHEASVHPEHQYLMLDKEPISILGQPYLRTTQWSGRPHLASTQFYRNVAAKYWPDSPMFIEHIMYGVVVEGAYDEFRLHIYAPEGTLVRSLHLDGRRKGAVNYDPNPS